MCEVHTTRAHLWNIPKKDQREVVEQLRDAYGSEQKLQEVADSLNSQRNRRAVMNIERFLPGLLNYTTFPNSTTKGFEP
jgi:hypothetical protein